MFCPTCGLTEDRPVLYCRSCGTDLRAVRTSLVAPDAGTNAAGTARDEIGRALATRIRDLQDLSELEDALPAIEKFLETPAERRLSRIRAGTICAAIGAGATVFFTLFALLERDMFFTPGLGVVCFLIGIGLIINGKFFTPDTEPGPAQLPAMPDESLRRFMSQPADQPALAPGNPLAAPASVTENTTRHLAGIVDEPSRKE